MDVISGGRIELGIGAGWSEDEYHAYGYDPPNLFGRIQQLNEALEIIKLTYTRDEPSFSGKYYSIVKRMLPEAYPKTLSTYYGWWNRRKTPP